MSHPMNKALLLAGLAVLLALPATALAGTCGVLPFSAGSDVNRGAAPNITALVSSELDIRGGYDLVIAADPEEFEGGDCGSSPACIKQFGQANKHEAVVAGTVAKSGDNAYTLTLKLHDGKSAELLRTVERDVPSSADALMDAVTAVVVELVTGEAPDEEDEGDGAAEEEGPLFEDLDFDEMMDEADEEVTPNNRQRGRAAPRNPGRDRDRDEDSDEDDPFGMDELDALDLSAEEMEKKRRDRERQAEMEREREASEERAARERAAEERRRRVAEERARQEEEQDRAERAERDRRARAERERREVAERERLEREKREREEAERQARADRERREREMEERAERDRARRDREEQERSARAEQARADREREKENARAERKRRDREEAEREEAEREEEERQARAKREERRSSSRDDDEYRRVRSRDEDMSARVDRERQRRRDEELDRAERESDDDEVEFESSVALAPATDIMIGSAFDDDDGGFQIGPGDDDDDDDYEDDGGITISSAAADIEFGDDDDDDEPIEGMIISDAADEDENPGVRRRREAEAADGDRYARARNFKSSSSSDQDDDDVDDDYRRDDEDEDEDEDEDSSERSSSRERRSSRSSDRDERVASRDDSYLSDDYEDEYDLDADSYSSTRRSSSRSKVSRSTTSSGNRPWFSARVSGGYTNYYLHFAQYGFDLSVFPAPRASVDVQVDFWTLSIRECPECEQEFRTLPSFYLGGSYRFTNLKIVQPYVGGDVGTVVYAIGTLDDGSGVVQRRPLMGAAFEVKGGVDIMFTRHFGISAGLKAGLAYAPKIKENVHPDWNPLQFLLNARLAAVVQF